MEYGIKIIYKIRHAVYELGIADLVKEYKAGDIARNKVDGIKIKEEEYKEEYRSRDKVEKELEKYKCRIWVDLESKVRIMYAEEYWIEKRVYDYEGWEVTRYFVKLAESLGAKKINEYTGAI